MARKPSKRRDRYNTSGNPETEYVDAEQTVLRNRKGITNLAALQLAEEEQLALAYRSLFREVRMDTPLTCELLQHMHGRIFGDLYDWAGRWRSVWISKPGTTWPAPDFVPQSMETFERDVLTKHPAKSLRDDDAFCTALGEIQGEFLVIHPFREGNARTIKLASDVLAAQTGRPPLAYDKGDEGRQAYVDAAKAAFAKNYGPMSRIIREALTPPGAVLQLHLEPSPGFFLKRRQPFDHTVALHDIEDAFDSLLFILQPGTAFFQRSSVTKGVHADSVAFLRSRSDGRPKVPSATRRRGHVRRRLAGGRARPCSSRASARGVLPGVATRFVSLPKRTKTHTDRSKQGGAGRMPSMGGVGEEQLWARKEETALAAP